MGANTTVTAPGDRTCPAGANAASRGGVSPHAGRGRRPAWGQRLGAVCGAHPWRVLAVWAVVLIALFAGSRQLGATYSDNVNLSGTQANTGLTLLQAHSKGAGGYSGTVVYKAAGPGALAADTAQVDDSVRALGQLPHVISVTNPLSPGSPAVSANGEIGYSTIEFNVEPATLGSSYVSQLDNATSAVRHAGVEVQYGGGLDQVTRPKPHDMTSEMFGFGSRWSSCWRSSAASSAPPCRFSPRWSAFWPGSASWASSPPASPSAPQRPRLPP